MATGSKRLRTRIAVLTCLPPALLPDIFTSAAVTLPLATSLVPHALAGELKKPRESNMTRISKAPKSDRSAVDPAQAMKPVAAGNAARSVEPPPAVTYAAVDFAQLPGWDRDDHVAALGAFALSCGRVMAAIKAGNASGSTPPPALLSACEDAATLLDGKPTKAKARAFFETHFVPHRVVHQGSDGMLTGYYEPVVEGARQPDANFATPIFKRPDDLVNLVAEQERGAKADQLTHARKTAAGFEPFPTRRQIEEGALAGRNLELAYLKDAIDVFFMQVQGSGRIALADGSSVRVTYDGKNGHPYTSIGRYLIDSGLFPAERMSLDALKQWLRDNPERMREVLWQNSSYVFFRELLPTEAQGPLGVLEIPLTPGRSLAVDTRFHAIGTPVYVVAPDLKHMSDKKGPFQRLMIAQDVGSAIRGEERGDIYVGSGEEAGQRAGITKHRGNFFVLVPREAMGPPLIEARDRGEPVKQARQ